MMSAQAASIAEQEERKELLPKCDICKVTIKRSDTMTVQCAGKDQKEAEDDSMQEQDEPKSKEASCVECQRRVHSSCLMERSKWKTVIQGG